MSWARRSPATKSLDDAKLDRLPAQDHVQDRRRRHQVRPNGEWAKSRVFQAQFRGIKGNGVDQFKNPETLAIITPAEYKSGDVIYPYEKARQ